MRAITVTVLACLAVLTAGYQSTEQERKYGDKESYLKQKVFFDILRNVYQNDEQTQYYKDASAWKFEENLDKFENVEAVKEFLQLYGLGMMKKDEVFSIVFAKHRRWAISLFNTFYYAKDWDTLYNSIVWAAYHVNPDMFIYALTVAVIHRPDLHGIELPAPFEVNPYYFFNAEIIQKAQWYKMNNFHGVKKVNGKYEVVIPMNYTTKNIHYSDEQKLAYFTEDIALNSYYYYFHTDYPFWMGGDEFHLHKDRRGELYLFEHQQLLARYYMERLSNHLGAIPELSYWQPIENGYYPHLRYRNGVSFAARSNSYNPFNEKNLYVIKENAEYEQRIREAIDYGYVDFPNGTRLDITHPDAIDIVGNMIQGNPDWPQWRISKYLTLYAKILLSQTMEPNPNFDDVKVAPSALEHFETAMRDPLSYMIFKRMLNYLCQFKEVLPRYTRNELSYKGVKIESLEMDDKLTTFFDNYDADITNVAKTGFVAEPEYMRQNFTIKARQSRLNHKPFTFKLNIASEITGKAVVRMFLGPKYNEHGNLIDFALGRENFWQMDSFTYDLKAGQNVIKRNSDRFVWFGNDRTPFSLLTEEMEDTLAGKRKYGMDMNEQHCSFPDRLMLPKGSKSGMPVQFFFMVSPYVAPEHEQYSTYDNILACGIGSGSRHIDARPFGYPLDREIDEASWYTPNMYYYDTMIYHRN